MRLENAMHFLQHPWNFMALQMDDAVKRDDPCERYVREIQAAHIAFVKWNIRAELPGALKHACGEVNAADLDSPVFEIPGDVSGAASQVTS